MQEACRRKKMRCLENEDLKERGYQQAALYAISPGRSAGLARTNRPRPRTRLNALIITNEKIASLVSISWCQLNKKNGYKGVK